MLTDEELITSLISAKFAHSPLIKKSEVRELVEQTLPDMSDQRFRRILYSLEKKKYLIPIGAGLFIHGDTTRSVDKPRLSKKAIAILYKVRKLFPYTESLVWETRRLHEFMIHQPSQNIIILEIEREISESVFLQLKEKISTNIVLDLDSKLHQRYFMDKQEMILVKPAISRQPIQKIDVLKTARLEKILVDVFVDQTIFSIYQGSEMINIYENAFQRYLINPKTLFRYAQRRTARKRLGDFLLNSTSIDPNLYLEFSK